jgi:CCDC81-like prokaryotic HU domain 2/CCDC81-like prokaryotic HU domain 1
MHQYLAQYLFTQHNCALPGLGNFFTQTNHAVYDNENKLINAPTQIIAFSQKEVSSKNLVEWLATQKNESIDTVTNELIDCVEKIKSTLLNNETAYLEHIGSFIMNSGGSIVFKPTELPKTFFNTIPANKINGTNYSQQSVNGNNGFSDTDSENYFDEETVADTKWWIWPLLLSILAIGLIILYLNVSHQTIFFGNNKSIF